MPIITIRWKSYDHAYPAVITEELYYAYKAKQINLPHIELKFLEVFYPKLIVILLGILCLIGESDSKDGGLAIIEWVVIIIAFVVFVKFLISASSYVESYKHTKKYIDSLNEILYYSESYDIFCITMCDIDKRYYLQINRNINL